MLSGKGNWVTLLGFCLMSRVAIDDNAFYQKFKNSQDTNSTYFARQVQNLISQLLGMEPGA